jgi:hypothetical protein
VHQVVYYRTMATHTFTLITDRIPDGPPINATFGRESGYPVADFDLEAPTLEEAITHACHELAQHGVTAVRVVEGDLVTLADVADRIGQSRESLRRYATAERGPGGFPPPVPAGRSGTLFYRWSEVASWLRASLALDADLDAHEAVLAYANLLVQARTLRAHLTNPEALEAMLTRAA